MKYLLPAIGLVLLFCAAPAALAQLEPKDQPARLYPVCEFFPSSIFDTEFTRSYAGARGTLSVVHTRTGPKWQLAVQGLRDGTEYIIYISSKPVKRGAANTAIGPWVILSRFTTRGGSATVTGLGPLLKPGTVYVNTNKEGRAILVSERLP